MNDRFEAGCRRVAEVILCSALVAAAASVAFAAPGGGGGGGPSQASLNVDTTGCPTSFGSLACEKRTGWSLDKSADNGSLTDPQDTPISYTVTVTEGPTTKILTISGILYVSNSGGLSARLTSVVALLERRLGREKRRFTGQRSYGPSGQNFKLLAVAGQNESAACDGLFPTCYGTPTGTPGSSVELFDADNNDAIALSGQVLIPATVDNDGDGLRDEDPPDGIDNDGDGATDEDTACQDATRIGFTAEWDITDLGLEGLTGGVRVSLLTTFDSAGSRGGGRSAASCTLDANCNSLIDADNPLTPLVNESENNNIRTVQQRVSLPFPTCVPLCQSVRLEDCGPTSNDPTCADLDGGPVSLTAPALAAAIEPSCQVDETISAGGEGNVTTRSVGGSVSCQGRACQTQVVNTARLSGSGCEGLIDPDEDTASNDVTCSQLEPPEPEAGDFCTQTQGGWGSVAKGLNPGVARDAHFATLFPSGLNLGDPDGPDGDGAYALLLTDADAVEDFLPAGGTPAALTADVTDPTSSAAGVFAGQLAAAKLNVAFNDAGLLTKGSSGSQLNPGVLKTLVYKASCVDAELAGLSVEQVIALSDTAISGGGTPAGVTISDLSAALDVLNQNFVDCDSNKGCLGFPSEGPADD